MSLCSGDLDFINKLIKKVIFYDYCQPEGLRLLKGNELIIAKQILCKINSDRDYFHLLHQFHILEDLSKESDNV